PARVGLAVATGLSIAATYLTKLSNLPLIFVTAGAIAWWCFAQARSRKPRVAIRALGAFVFCAAAPIISWMLWMKIHFGDFTGAASKAQLLGWRAKPFADWWSHPIFTAAGMWTFLCELIASFWRGEFMWHKHTIGFKEMDLFYLIFSLGLILVAVISLWRERAKNALQAQRRALWIAAA